MPSGQALHVPTSSRGSATIRRAGCVPGVILNRADRISEARTSRRIGRRVPSGVVDLDEHLAAGVVDLADRDHVDAQPLHRLPMRFGEAGDLLLEAGGVGEVQAPAPAVDDQPRPYLRYRIDRHFTPRLPPLGTCTSRGPAVAAAARARRSGQCRRRGFRPGFRHRRRESASGRDRPARRQAPQQHWPANGLIWPKTTMATTWHGDYT
jgi:hypothetical protein